MTRTRAIETPSTLPTIWAVSDSEPCPCSVMLVWQITEPGGVEPHRDAVLRRDLRAADAVKRRAWIGDLDKTGDADAAMNVLLAQRRLFGAQRVVVHHRHQLVQRGMMRQQFEPQAGGRGAGIGVVGNQIAAADLHRVHADFQRREIDQAFGHRAGDGVADAAILAHHVLVLEHDAGARAVVLASCTDRRRG